MGRTKDYFPNIPEKCPKMKTCEKKVDFTDYELLCNDELWIYCEKNKLELSKYKRKPREWKLVEKLK